jgi:hypothetical protein
MRLSSSVLGAAAGLLAAAPAFAGTVVTGLHDTLAAYAEHDVDRCPGKVVFTGVIEVKGAFQKGQKAEIGYQFARSDGAVSQNRYLEVPAPGVYHVVETWTLGGPPSAQVSGWAKFKAWTTDSAQNRAGDSWSNAARFTLTCRG